MIIPRSKAAFVDAAAACEFLAFSFKEPDEALVGAILSDEWVEVGDGMDAALELGLPDDWAFDFIDDAPEAADAQGGVVAFLESLRVEASRLFGDELGVFEPIAVPRESACLGLDADALIRELEGIYASAGFVPGEGNAELANTTEEPADSLVTELSYLAYLARIAAGEDEPQGGLGEAELPGGSARAAYRDFAKTHVAAWMGDFADVIAAQAKSAFYRAAGQALAAFLAK